MKYIKVDEQGYFIEDVIMDKCPTILKLAKDENDKETQIFVQNPYYLTETPVGFYTPKWDFDKKQWVEGKTQAEIDAIKNKKQPLTKVEKRMQKLERQLKASGEENEFLADLIAELAMKLYD